MHGQQAAQPEPNPRLPISRIVTEPRDPSVSGQGVISVSFFRGGNGELPNGIKKAKGIPGQSPGIRTSLRAWLE